MNQSESVPEFISKILYKVADQEGFIDYTIDHVFKEAEGNHLASFVRGVIIRGVRPIDGVNQMDELHLIYKVVPEEVSQFDMYGVQHLFEREIYMYTKILPAMVNFQKERNISEENGFYHFPKIYSFLCDPEKHQLMIVFEDLKKNDFKLSKQLHNIDLEHMQMILNKMAKFHAISFAMRDQVPHEFSRMKLELKDVFVPPRINNPYLNALTKNSIDALLESLDENDVKEMEKIKDYPEKFTQFLEECVDLDVSEPFAVIGHGDSWCNNYMFTYDENSQPKNVNFLDWQLGRYGSIALDVSHLIFISTTTEFRAKYYDQLINFYYESLINAIDQLGSNGKQLIPFDNFLGQMHQFGKFGLILAPMFLIYFSIVLDDKPNEISKFDYFNMVINYQTKIIFTNANDIFRNLVRNLIKDCVTFGCL